MDAHERGALTLVWLIAVMLVAVSLLELGLYWLEHAHAKPPQPIRILPVLGRALPALAGFAMLARARALAKWISNILDL